MTIIKLSGYNAASWLNKCLPPLFPLPEGWKVIVVDNASTDGSVTQIRARFPEVHCLENAENMGFGKANNQGMQLAIREDADYVFLLNQDAWISSQDIALLASVQQDHPEFAIVSPVHLAGDAYHMDKGFEYCCAQPPANCIFSDLLLGRKLLPIYETAFVNAAARLVSRECLLTVGGFDPLFFHYGEDVDYVRRVYSSGKKIGIVPNVFACHDREGRISTSERTLREISNCLLEVTGAQGNYLRLSLRVGRLFLWASKEFLLLRFSGAVFIIKNILFLFKCSFRIRNQRNCSLG